MTIRRFLIIVIPILFLFSLVYFLIMPKVLQGENQNFPAARQKGWTIYFEPTEGLDYTRGGDVGDGNHIVIDPTGKIWIAGGTGLGGLNVFDGTTWSRYPETYVDLALGPQGQILAVAPFVGIVEVTDVLAEQSLKTYEGPIRQEGAETIKERLEEVEIDSNGRIWVISFSFRNDIETYTLSEMFIENNEAVATFSPPEITIQSGLIKSLDADNQGNIWVSIWAGGDRNSANEWESGLYVFNGEVWEQMSGQGMDLQLQEVVQTTFDKQGHAWVVTACGSVMTYDGENWDTIWAEDAKTNCKHDPLLEGISLDNQDRVWVWNRKSVKYFNGQDWTKFTSENSGVMGSGSYPIGPFIHDVIADNLGRVWVSSSVGISMGVIEDIQPLDEEVISQHDRIVASTNRLQGKVWLIPLLLALLWFALFFNMPRSIVLSLILGLVLSIFMGPLKIEEPDNYSYINPLFTASLVGIVFGYLCSLNFNLGGFRKNFETKWDIIVTILGFVIGFSYGMFMKLLPAMLH